MINYHEVINWFIKKEGFFSYLELGVRDPQATFNKVNAAYKESVDCAPCGATYTMTTDEYFAGPGKDKSFDVYFVDASHRYSDVNRDIANIFERWGENSVIIMDDINPEEEWLLDEKWCGTAWQTWADLRKNPDLSMHAFAGTRFGFVRKGNQEPLTKEVEPTFEFLSKNREELMNFVSFERLKEDEVKTRLRPFLGQREIKIFFE